MIKAVFFDIDETIFSHVLGRVPDSAKAAVGQLRESGIKVFVSTGRHMTSLDQLPLDGMEFDGYITLNGQLCLDAGKKFLWGTPFDRKITERLVPIFRSGQVPLILVEEDRFYINKINQTVRKAQATISTLLPDIGEYSGRPLYQAIAYLGKDGQSRMEKELGPGCKIIHWNSQAIDIIPAGGGKARGMEFFMSKLGFSPGETMAFGDAENDIDMLKYAGVGVAMGNAEKGVRDIADYVTERAEQDGIWRALEHFHMIRERNG